ncbi:hypothetical protein ES707_14233 [subsurface metagenome]
MQKSKDEKIRKYIYILIIKCEKCGAVAKFVGPCTECKNMTFKRIYEAQEVE